MEGGNIRLVGVVGHGGDAGFEIDQDIFDTGSGQERLPDRLHTLLASHALDADADGYQILRLALPKGFQKVL